MWRLRYKRAGSFLNSLNPDYIFRGLRIRLQRVRPGGPPIRVERLALGLLTLLPFDGNSQLVERLDYLVFKNTLWDASVAVLYLPDLSLSMVTLTSECWLGRFFHPPSTPQPSCSCKDLP